MYLSHVISSVVFLPIFIMSRFKSPFAYFISTITTAIINMLILTTQIWKLNVDSFVMSAFSMMMGLNAVFRSGPFPCFIKLDKHHQLVMFQATKCFIGVKSGIILSSYKTGKDSIYLS